MDTERWKQVDNLLHLVLGRPAEDREAYLKRASGGDKVLEREVRSLLDSQQQAGDFLESSAIEMVARVYAKDEAAFGISAAAVGLGAMVGHYRLTGKLGEGGMGEVYRAFDTKLHRDVALKMLPEAMAWDGQRMARFEREAQVLASLNHPNIAAIHGLEESNGVRVLVMELVEGETVAERLSATAVYDRPLPPEKSPVQVAPLQPDGALPIAKQIAEALEFAHERGVIHRDLKPANVKITPEGTVKVLDFGLAKVLRPQDSSTVFDPANSPRLSTMTTQAGVILGTAAYMSPEQAKGKHVDRRCDIWAFGCVLYEMLSGKKPFEGETISDVLVAVITKDPDWTALPETTPPAIQKLIRRCLVKDAKQRLRDIGDARITIEETLAGDVAAGLPDQTQTGKPAEIGDINSLLRRAMPWALAGLLVVALIEGLAIWKLAVITSRTSPLLAYIPPPTNTTFRNFGFGAGPAVVSPDGKELAFSATDQKGVTQLWVRSLGSSRVQAIAGTEDAAMPFWSPDGSSLGFFADQRLKSVNIENGNVEVLAYTSCLGAGGAWSATGTILFTTQCHGPLDKISSAGGMPSPATRLESGETDHTAPAFLPDGRHFLYVASSINAPPSIWLGSLGSMDQKQVLERASSPQFSFGHLFFIRDNRVFAQPFNPATGELAGQASTLAEAQSYSVSSQVLAFQGGTPEGRLEWFDRNGNLLGSVGPVADYEAAKISPDGRHILADIMDPQSKSWDLWSYPAAGGLGTRLTFEPGVKTFSVWSPDGKYIAYSCQPGGKAGICRKPADGSGSKKTLFTFGTEVSRVNVVDWSPDGRYVSFDEFLTKAPGTEDWILPLFGDHKPFRVAFASAAQYDGHFSPDGHWLAYFSYEAGGPQVYVVPFPGPGGKFQISQNGGWLVHWDKEGHLYFLTMGNRLMEADLATNGASLRVKSIHPLFQLSTPSFAAPFFDVTNDGSRFLIITSTDPNASRSVGLLLDWQLKLKGK